MEAAGLFLVLAKHLFKRPRMLTGRRGSRHFEGIRGRSLPPLQPFWHCWRRSSPLFWLIVLEKMFNLRVRSPHFLLLCSTSLQNGFFAYLTMGLKKMFARHLWVHCLFLRIFWSSCFSRRVDDLDNCLGDRSTPFSVSLLFTASTLHSTCVQMV